MFRLSYAVLAFVLAAGPAGASDQLNQRIARIFGTKDFARKTFGPARWIEKGEAYTTVEPSAAGKDGHVIVRYETATGKRDVLISAAQLTPKGGKPLEVEDYIWSGHSQRLLIFTNTRKVWRENTRGDYW